MLCELYKIIVNIVLKIIYILIYNISVKCFFIENNMKSNIKNLLIMLFSIASCNAMWNQNQFNNNINNIHINNIHQNNININNLLNKYVYNIDKWDKNSALRKMYYDSRTVKNGYQYCTTFDWNLLTYNMQTCDKYLMNSIISNILNEMPNNTQFSKSVLIGLAKYYAQDNEWKQTGTKAIYLEIINMIANYYIMTIQNRNNNIEKIQNDLLFIFPNQSNMLFPTLNNYGYQQYYSNYYLPRLNNQQFNNVLPFYYTNIRLDDWNMAVSIIKTIDLASIIKKWIVLTNIGALYTRFNLQI